MAQPTKPKGGNDYSKINMLPPISGDKPNPRPVAVKKDKQKDYQKKGYKYLGQKTPDLDNLQSVKKVKSTKKKKKTKPIIKVQEEKDFIVNNIKENKMNLKQIYRSIKEQQEKKQILLDDLDKDVCENCGEGIHEGECF